MTKKYDILIIGAGPAGTTCALALKDSGLKVALLDKSSFPRDKICGDAIPGPAFKVMRSISPDFEKELFAFAKKQSITISKIIAPNGKSLAINWVTKAYNSPRFDFDSFLLDMVSKHSKSSIYENTEVEKISIDKKGVQVICKDDGPIFQCQLVIGADGANGICARELTGFSLDRKHHCAAVRAYYQGVKGVERGVNEFYILKDYLPGYFWIFPLRSDLVNVGFGMLSSEISVRKINLKKSLETILQSNPLLKKKFRNARLVGKIKGFGLPFGSRLALLSGERFMLTGDAGSLIDPLQGHGIDKGMWSGKMAAAQAIRCFQKEHFDADFMRQYEREVYQKHGQAFRRNYRIMKLLASFPSVVTMLINLTQVPFCKKAFLKIIKLAKF